MEHEKKNPVLEKCEQVFHGLEVAIKRKINEKYTSTENSCFLEYFITKTKRHWMRWEYVTTKEYRHFPHF